MNAATFTKSLAKIAKYPVQEGLKYFLPLLILGTAIDVVTMGFRSEFKDALYFFIFNCVVTYFVSAAICLFPNRRGRHVLWIICMIVYSLIALIDIVCQLSFKTYFHYELALIILSTNPKEATEFIESYFNYSYAIIWICLIVASIISHIVASRHNIGHKFWKWTVISCMICTPIIFIDDYSMARIVTPAKCRWFFTCDKTPDLNSYLNHPEILVDNDVMPRHVVLIIGESFSKHHSSLYGYDKPTNPRLAEWVESGQAIIYDSVSSPASFTVGSFMQIMTTANGMVDNWYKYLKVPEIFNEAGFETRWFSNQNKYGSIDNLPSSFSTMCDKEAYVDSKFHIKQGRNTFDGDILPLFAAQPPVNDQPAFSVIHFIGSHPHFRNRYPRGFGHFSTLDYPDAPSHQRQLLSEYDNSVLYNDFVVDSILNICDSQDCIVVYLPDHGLDVFYSHDDYAGHGLWGDSISTRYSQDIPFMIFLSKPYLKRHQELYKQYRQESHIPFNSTDLPYFLMKVSGLQFKESYDPRQPLP